MGEEPLPTSEIILYQTINQWPFESRRDRAAFGVQLKTNDLTIIPHQQPPASERGWIPSHRVQRGKAGEFFEAIRHGLHQRDESRLGLDEQQPADKRVLAKAVTALAPAAFAGGEVDACERAFVEAIGKPVAHRHAAELGARRFARPDRRA